MPAKTYNILFVCVHNSARSQMAEAFLKHFGNDHFRAESAGLRAGTLNPYAIEVMQEIGIDIRNNQTNEVFDLFRKGKMYQAVITVCDEANAEKCPIFPGMIKRLTWSFPDPSQFKGTRDEILLQTREVRDQIKDKVIQFIEEASELNFWMSMPSERISKS